MLAFCVVLGVKEIAIDALIFIAMYELVEDPSLFSRPLPWLGRRKRLLALAAIAAAFCLSQVFDPNSLSHMPAYQITLSWATYREHVEYLLDEAFNQPVTAWQALLVITLASLRSVRVCVWSVVCFLAGALPIAFIPQRGLDAAAIPTIALAVLVGVAVEALCVAVAAFTSKRLGFMLAGTWFVVILLAQGSAASRGAGIEFPPRTLLSRPPSRHWIISPRPRLATRILSSIPTRLEVSPGLTSSSSACITAIPALT